jgi:hypothetical protein
MSKKRARPAPARRPVDDIVFAARERGAFAGAEHAELTGLSTDTLRRRYTHLIRRLSPRRVGMKLRDVLTIGTSEDSAPAA